MSTFGVCTGHRHCIYNCNICSSLVERVPYSLLFPVLKSLFHYLSSSHSLSLLLLIFVARFFFLNIADSISERSIFGGCELFALRVQTKLRMNGNYNNYQTVSPANAAVEHSSESVEMACNNAKPKKHRNECSVDQFSSRSLLIRDKYRI